MQTKNRGGITNGHLKSDPNFKNYKRTHSNSLAHDSQIVSISWIDSQLYATASKQGEIKIWNSSEEVLLFGEEGEVTGLCYLGNFNLIYVFLTKLKCLNLKSGKVKVIHQSDKKITASTYQDT